MQSEQSIEQLGLQLQTLARKAFPESSGKEFDRLLKGRFLQSLLPKWQRKFQELYDRARTLE